MLQSGRSGFTVTGSTAFPHDRMILQFLLAASGCHVYYYYFITIIIMRIPVSHFTEEDDTMNMTDAIYADAAPVNTVTSGADRSAMNAKKGLLRRVRHGFTLLEMMIVLGIIAVLTAVMVPVASGYLTRSRVNTANSDAKVIFNSLQTLMQEYEFSDRPLRFNGEGSQIYGSANSGTIFIYCNNGNISTFSVTPASGTAPTLGAAFLGSTQSDRDSNPGSFGAKLARLHTSFNTVTWAAYISDYSVWGVVAASSTTTSYMGGCPNKATERGSFTKSDGSILTFNSFDSYTAATLEPLVAEYATDAFS